jgi:hypothetical protein
MGLMFTIPLCAETLLEAGDLAGKGGAQGDRSTGPGPEGRCRVCGHENRSSGTPSPPRLADEVDTESRVFLSQVELVKLLSWVLKLSGLVKALGNYLEKSATVGVRGWLNGCVATERICQKQNLQGVDLTFVGSQASTAIVEAKTRPGQD